MRASKHLNANICAHLFDEKNGAFFDGTKTGRLTFSEMGNSLAILCGAAQERKRVIAEKLVNGSLEKCELPARFFKYEALCECGDYANYIIKDIDVTCFKMLKKDATTFWETEEGERAFKYAGSLSHAWSSFAVRYYRKFEV